MIKRIKRKGSLIYKGIVQTLNIGLGGLHTDDPDTQIPPTDMKRALNITFEGNKASKAPGALKFNQTALSGGVLEAIDWWPNDVTQRVIAVTSDGEVWKMPNGYSQSLIPNVLDTTQNKLIIDTQAMIVQGGAETAIANRKLFIMTGNNAIQVISGDQDTRTDISLPAIDWQTSSNTPSTNQPFAGLIHNNRFWTWGNKNNPHMLYASNPSNHEDFQTADEATFWSVFPGEQQGILACYVFKGRMFIFKFPSGIYYLDDTDPSTDNWIIRKYMDNFGAASAHSGATILNDMYIANSFGSITSAAAVQYYGGFDMADLLVNTRTASYVSENISPKGQIARYMISYEAKKQLFVSYRSSAGIQNDSILNVDFSSPSQTPKVSWWNHLQPNCMFLKKDVNNIPRPCYGANDGFIYLMDQKNRSVNGNGYLMDIMTPAIDFNTAQSTVMALPAQVTEVNKIFDFLEITGEATGKWSLNVDIFIDGKFSETLQFTQSVLKGTNEFQTNIDRTYDGFPFQVRKRMHGYGKRVALRFYNNVANENITLLKAQFYIRLGSQGEKDAS